MKGARPVKPAYVSTTNACKLCKPLGACLVFRGIEGAVPFLHGSQGCATYMRRYLISHFREPVDIASSSLGEKHAVFGGGPNLKQGLRNVIAKYRPGLVGVASTCLTETIGDDVPHLLTEFRAEAAAAGIDVPEVVAVSTPSYTGTHMEGFHVAVRGLVDQLARRREPTAAVNVLPGFVSPVDLRHLKDLLSDFGLPCVVLPDYSETLDGPALEEYPLIPEGGTPLEAIRGMGGASATLELGRTVSGPGTAGALLAERHGVPLRRLGTPIGLRETDRLFAALEELSGRPTPRAHALERGRLVDAYVDGHKYVFGKKAVLFGEEDLVVGLASFLSEVGVRPVLCASGGTSGRLEEAVRQVTEGLLPDPPRVREGVDFYEIEEELEALGPDLLIGHSKGYQLAKKRGIPLLRVGFPVHDRFGGQRILHIGYRGAQGLYDTLVNTLLEVKQEGSSVGYGYL
jgi:nitrogenase molybdenum-iron protein NifN